MFSEELKRYDWQETLETIKRKTSADVVAALSKKKIGIDDFMALISPSAIPFLEQMATKSQALTRRRFGNTISMFIPLYITNSCLNGCVYCGFNHKNLFKRVILTPAQIEEECKAIKRLAPFENLLIVTGENPKVAGTDYIAEALKVCRKYFSNLTIEVMPLPSEDYDRLRREGLNGVVCFQETYNRDRYKLYHPVGMKSDFEWRVNGFDRMGMAGVHKIGMGVLIGLEDWRTDVTMMARHLLYLKKKYWTTRYSVNFPRMRPSESGFQPNVVMSDRELAQLTFAFRILDPDLDISFSTREEHTFRTNMAPLGVTTMSAGSRTEPGGYAKTGEALEQFAISDDSSPAAVARDLVKIGLQPVWKDWDEAFNMNNRAAKNYTEI